MFAVVIRTQFQVLSVSMVCRMFSVVIRTQSRVLSVSRVCCIFSVFIWFLGGLLLWASVLVYSICRLTN